MCVPLCVWVCVLVCSLVWVTFACCAQAVAVCERSESLAVKANRVVANATNILSASPAAQVDSLPLPFSAFSRISRCLQMTRAHSKLTKMSKESKDSAMTVARNDNQTQ